MASAAPTPSRRNAFDGLGLGTGLGSAHRGLLLDKFVASLGKGEDNDRHRLIDAVCERAWHTAESPYAGAFERWKSIWADSALAAIVEARCDAPLAIGHGAKGVLDGGVRLHRTYGLPLIPGSSVRGAVSAYADDVLGAADPRWSAGRRISGQPNVDQGEYHKLLFGDTDDAGRLAFEDAWWTPKKDAKPLKRDVITPHHQEYYTGLPRMEPAETDDPVPVTIPVVRPESGFLFVVRWQARPDDGEGAAAQWLAIARDLLANALEQQGLGAKGSQGYGRCRIDHEAASGAQAEQEARARVAAAAAAAAAEKLRLAEMDPLQRELHEIAKSGSEGAATKWAKLLDTDRPAEELRQIAGMIRTEMGARWRPNSNAKRPEKDHDHQLTLRVQKHLS